MKFVLLKETFDKESVEILVKQAIVILIRYLI